jgi:hypothetical protein
MPHPLELTGAGPENFSNYVWSIYYGTIIIRSRVSSGSIVSDYGLDDRAIGFRSPAGENDFSSILCVQTGSGAHPAFCPMGTGGPFPRGKAWSERDADHSLHLVPRSWMSWSYTSSPPQAPPRRVAGLLYFTFTIIISGSTILVRTLSASRGRFCNPF